MMLIEYKDGFVIAKITSEGGGMNLEVVSYTGTNEACRDYHKPGQRYWTNGVDSEFRKYKRISEETHPEYFL